MTFAQMLAEENLLLPLERLHYFSHWITPQILPLRYDVRFLWQNCLHGRLLRMMELN